MIREGQETRRLRYDEELKMLLYQTFKLRQDLEQKEKRILQLEGLIDENESTRRDISTEEAIKSKQETKEVS